MPLYLKALANAPDLAWRTTVGLWSLGAELACGHHALRRSMALDVASIPAVRAVQAHAGDARVDADAAPKCTRCRRSSPRCRLLKAAMR